MTQPTHDAVMEALSRVIDPELHRPITDLGMVSSVDIAEDGVVRVEVLLTVAGCPLKDTITADTRREVSTVEGVTEVQVSLGVMNDEQKAELRRRLRGGAAEPVVPFTQPGNLTRVYAVTSGKGGVGKSSVTANLAAAMAAQGLSVGVVDADIYGFSIPRMLGVERVPTQLDGMIVPPVAHGVKVISIGMFVEDTQPVVVLAGFSCRPRSGLGVWGANPGSSDSYFAVVGPAALVGRVADVWRSRHSSAQVCCIILT